jgi:hypothetical protein
LPRAIAGAQSRWYWVMSNEYYTSSNSSSTANIEWVQFWHGTDIASANWISTKGLNLVRLKQTEGAYAFCTTTDQKIAGVYAKINPARGIPVVLGFQIPFATLKDLLTIEPDWVFKEDIVDKAYEFYPQTFYTMNSVMINFSVQHVNKLNLTFD